MPTMGWLTGIAAAVTVLLWQLLRRRRQRPGYWAERGVPEYTTPHSLSNPLQFFKSLTPGLPKVQEMYDSTDEPLLGFYKGRSPVLMARDPQLVHRILKTDFLHFTDKRRPYTSDSTVDPLGQHLIGLTGERWKTLRSKLTPVFSSGKIREAVPLFKEAVDDLFQDLGHSKTVNVYQTTVKTVSDIILSYGFGLDKDDPERKKVREMGLKSVYMDWKESVRRGLRFNLPWLFKALKMRAFDPQVTSYFVGFVRRALSGSLRQSSRANFLQRLFEIADQLPDKGREGLLAAQVFSFFVAGFETTCLALSTCLFELAKHPDVVQKAREEVNKVISDRSAINYDDIKKTNYITQVIKENMRIYPADYATPRVCTAEYKIDELGVTIEKGTELLIPGFCLARDGRYHPQPLLFDPERFSTTRKEDIKPGTYFPFGDGPRQCIAVRFSMMEMEYFVARLIMEYDLELDPKTPKVLEFDPQSRVTHFKNDIHIHFKKRMT